MSTNGPSLRSKNTKYLSNSFNLEWDPYIQIRLGGAILIYGSQPKIYRNVRDPYIHQTLKTILSLGTCIFTKPMQQSRDLHIHKTLAATTTTKTTVCLKKFVYFLRDPYIKIVPFFSLFLQAKSMVLETMLEKS